MWLYPSPTPEQLRSVYDDNYFRNDKFFSDQSHLYGYYDYFEERFRKQSAYVGLIREIKTLLPSFSDGSSRLLDVGCGLGYLMDVAHDEGFDVSGVEFNEAAAKRLGAKYIFPVYAGNVLTYRDEPFDVITMMDVVEHLIEPETGIRHIRTLLKKDGILVLTTMDSDGWVSRLIGARLEDFRRVREHLHFFTRRSIRDMLARQGLDVFRIRYHGHHFRLGLLAHRIRGLLPIAGHGLEYVVKALRLEQKTVYVNPLTKMIVFARKSERE